MSDSKNRILIVDDEPDVVDFLTYNFTKSGYEVRGAKDGIEGLEKVRAFNPDLIIADIMMPEMNGINMCRILKADKNLRHIPLIFLSASQDDYQVMNAGLAGSEHYVSKPVKFSRLLSLVEEFFTLPAK